MPLKDAEIRAFKPAEKPYRRADEKGLYVEVMPNGSKLWRFKFRHLGKEDRLPLGAYPEVTLGAARVARDEARALVKQGISPTQERKRANRLSKLQTENSFASIAEEFIAKQERERKAATTTSKQRWYVSLINGAIGGRPITDIEPAELLDALKAIERKGHLESASRTRSLASRIFRYAVATGRAKTDPAAVLRGALITPQAKHHAAILEPVKFGELLRAINAYGGQASTCIALQIAPHVFLRPGELRQAEWSEIDLEQGIWRVAAEKMKLRRPHAVPISRQVRVLLEQLELLTGGTRYLFPAMTSLHRPMSENTVNQALRRMGFDHDTHTAHGFRASASTMLNESGLWHPDAVERALAHGESDVSRGAYNRGTYWEERVRMMQWWSDRIDAMRQGGEIIPIESKRRK